MSSLLIDDAFCTMLQIPFVLKIKNFLQATDFLLDNPDLNAPGLA